MKTIATKEILSGIYRITNPEGKVYIGQSYNINSRLKKYKNNGCRDQTGIYDSLVRFGWEKHKFDIIELCDKKALLERERHWQDYYNVLVDGLNLIKTPTKDKKREASKKLTQNISKGLQLFYKTHRSALLGVPKSLSMREKLSKSHTGLKLSAETRQKLSAMRSLNGAVNAKKIIDKQNNIIYRSIKDAAASLGIKRTTLSRYLSNGRPNITQMQYYEGI